MRIGRAWFYGLLILVSAQSELLAQESKPEEITIYQGPEVIKRAPPYYPRSGLQKGQEAWVDINFMVDVNGKTFAPVVTDSTGFKYFESAALGALKRYKYVLALDNGMPVEASESVRIRFEIEGGASAKKKFRLNYESFIEALNNESKEAADIALQNLSQVEGSV